MAMSEVQEKAEATVACVFDVLDGLRQRGLACDTAEVTPFAVKLTGIHVVLNDAEMQQAEAEAKQAEGRAALKKMTGGPW